ncbi:hypothetical protein AMIS_35850 [Actinoplanes missouriensis 431]|uniref:Aminoglycoside phosphotransferase domain-containing protein n=1 Tax=Actinoplanes missouriensis (strain ATCC 14538 / DSM 43046 / CBS 188.64 / JCM 3121 / NBRC 102363 / NCIMB 12654 / NRRL B-3342 / UNCC 431) TaxID=512565 RepID=I0H718_ACTM4|nr:phosphotransferase [Actinoplanes missouriensis]BAL88805.1 hypothetical protein AMIS_35850 [Actinoplanes missouriensis 431]
MRTNDWNDIGWQSEADAWLTARLDELGTPPTGPIERVRVRPWSVTHRAPTAAGTRWFKANITACRYEAALADALTGIAPGATLAPLATDAERGWMVTADAGPTLRETRTAANRTATWIDMLQAYAALQRATAPHVTALLALGVPDQRVTMLPATLTALLSDPQVHATIGPAEQANFSEWCAALSADGIPPALQHDDLHDGNVFADLRFFDWGDASIAHPFGSLLVALNVMHDAMDAADRQRELGRLRDAYLEPWSDLADLPTLRSSVTLACRVTRVSRAVAWQRALRDAAVPVDEQFRTAPQAWLNELTADTTV